MNKIKLILLLFCATTIVMLSQSDKTGNALMQDKSCEEGQGKTIDNNKTNTLIYKFKEPIGELTGVLLAAYHVAAVHLYGNDNYSTDQRIDQKYDVRFYQYENIVLVLFSKPKIKKKNYDNNSTEGITWTQRTVGGGFSVYVDIETLNIIKSQPNR